MAGGLVGFLDYLDQKEGRAQYGSLLDSYRYQNPPAGTLGDDGLSMPPQSGFVGQGGLVTGGPPPEFYNRAGGIRGYEGLAQQAQVGQQAMERQMQGQQWSMTNMPLAQKTELDMRQSQQNWERTRFNPETGMSYYETAMVAQAKARLDAENRWRAQQGGGAGGGGVAAGTAQLGAIPAGHMMTIDPQTGQPVLTPLQGGEAWRGQRENIQKLNTGVQAIDEMIKFVGDKGSFESGAEGGRIAAGPRQTVIAGLAALNNMGVLQPGELAVLEKQIADPTSATSMLPWNYETNATVTGKLQGVRERFIQASKNAASRSSGAASAPSPPPGFR